MTNMTPEATRWRLERRVRVTRISAFKIRATANLGKFTYFDLESIAEDYANYKQSSFNISGKGQFALTFVFMAFTSKWEEASWYR